MILGRFEFTMEVFTVLIFHQFSKGTCKGMVLCCKSYALKIHYEIQSF